MVTALLILAFTFTDTATTLFALTFCGATEMNPAYYTMGPTLFWAGKWIYSTSVALMAYWVWTGKYKDFLSLTRAVFWGAALIPATASMLNAIRLAVWSWGL